MRCKKEQVNADTQQLSKYMFEDHWDKREMHLHFYMLVCPQMKRFICMMASFYYYYQNLSILVKIKAFVIYT